MTVSGTSAAAPFVTGTIGLLYSLLPRSSASEIRMALNGGAMRRNLSLVPPLLDAFRAFSGLMDLGPANAPQADFRYLETDEGGEGPVGKELWKPRAQVG